MFHFPGMFFFYPGQVLEACVYQVGRHGCQQGQHQGAGIFCCEGVPFGNSCGEPCGRGHVSVVPSLGEVSISVT